MNEYRFLNGVYNELAVNNNKKKNHLKTFFLLDTSTIARFNPRV